MSIVRNKGVTEVRKGMMIVLVLLSLTTVGQDLRIDFQKDSDTDFREYKTYFWASQIDNQLDEESCFLNNVMLKADVRNAVHAEMESRGYLMDEHSPDLLINFRVFDRAVKLKSSYDYGRSYWKRDEFFSSDVFAGEIFVEAGTLIISILDRRDSKMVWQGIASGLEHDGEFIKDEGKVREAVELIFDKYGYRASIYTRR